MFSKEQILKKSSLRKDSSLLLSMKSGGFNVASLVPSDPRTIEKHMETRSPAAISFPDSEASRFPDFEVSHHRTQTPFLSTPRNVDQNQCEEFIYNHSETAPHRHRAWLGPEEAQCLLSMHAVEAVALCSLLFQLP